MSVVGSATTEPGGIHFYTLLKTVTERWPTNIRGGAWFQFGGTADH